MYYEGAPFPLFNLLPTHPNLELGNPMRPLPIMSMVRKRLKLRLGDPGVNTHLQNDLSRQIFSDGADRATQSVSAPQQPKQRKRQ